METGFYFDWKKPFYKSPFGAAARGTVISFRAKAIRTEFSEVTAVFFIETTGKELRIPMDWNESGDHCCCILKTDFPAGLVWYYFETRDFNGNILCWGKRANRPSQAPQDLFQLTLYDEKFETSDWFCRGVTYHIFIDRFHRGVKSAPLKTCADFFVHENLSDTPEYKSDDKGEILNRDIYGGDLRGIIDKLPYIYSLGVQTIYLSPMFEAWSNHKYNTADYHKIDIHFGTEEDFKELCQKAGQLGMRVILDGVFSHTGSDSVYFNAEGRYPALGAYQSADSVYRKWYQFDEQGNYSSWWGILTLPQVRELEPTYLDFIVENKESVIEHWMNAGASGWRLDVADELPDEFIMRLRDKARQIKKDALIIGEVWEDASNKHAYGVRKKYFTDCVLDGVMNYPVKNAILEFISGDSSAIKLKDTFETILENYPRPAHRCLMNLIGTHDTVRAINALACRELLHESKDIKADYKLSKESRAYGKKLMMQAVNLQYMYPGSPCIYYGDEIAMEGFEDPFNRRYYEWWNQDEEMLGYYRTLGALKKTNPVMHEGEFEVVYCDNDCIVITRTLNNDQVLSVVSRADTQKSLSLPITGRFYDILSGKIYESENEVLNLLVAEHANIIMTAKN